jgi:hypothetical protein
MSLTRLRVGDTLLLRAMFRLPEDVTLEAAEIERTEHGAAVLLLTVDLPDAPPAAVSVDVTYERRTDMPDPVRVTGYRYFREDGTEITEPAGLPAPIPA